MNMSVSFPNRGMDRRELESRRDFVMTVLNGLHVDFEAMGLLEEAGPHLHKLLDLAFHAQTGETGT
jgi:hypothetical protein